MEAAGRQPEEGGGARASRPTAGWSDATKQAALTKLAKMDVMVGYPDKFRDYSKLAMKRGRPLRQRQAQLGLRMGLSAERPRQAGRPQEVGDEPGDGERL